MNPSLKGKIVAFALAFAAAGLFAADFAVEPDRVVEIPAPLAPPAVRADDTPGPRECQADVGITTGCTYQ